MATETTDIRALAFIDDGQNRHGYVKPEPRLYPECRFTFRPCTPQERSIILSQVAAANAQDENEIAAALIAKRVIQWSLQRATQDGFETAPIQVAVTRKLQPRLQVQMFNQILGSVAPDPDPEFDKNGGDPAASLRMLDAAMDGMPDPESVEGRAKNS